MTTENFPRTELDGLYRWECQECSFESIFMYKADTHQCETDHLMKRVRIIPYNRSSKQLHELPGSNTT